ncbi:MAG: right-handed parallel beta-helix repeat-containing protein, partial [Bacteroidia bacterium]
MQPTYNWTGSLSQYEKDTVNIGTYTINSGDNLRVWTRLPNGQNEPAGVAYNDTASLLVKAGITGNYTVGGAGADYADFSSVVSDLNAFGVCGPATFTAVTGSGPFLEKLDIGEIIGASSTNTITLDGNGETILFDGSSSPYAAVLLNGADWITLKNFTLDGTSGSAGFGILMTNAADNNTISNNTVLLNTGSTSSLFAGIGLSNSTTSFTSTGGNSGNNNTIIGNTVVGGYYAYSAAGQNTTTFCTGNRFLNNTATDFYFYGIYSYYQDEIDIVGNNFTKRTSGATTVSGYGIYSIYNSHFNFTHNKLISWGTYGIYGSSANTLSTGATDRSYIANNFIANNGQVTTNYGIYLPSTTMLNVDLYNNSIYLTGGSNGRGIYITGASTSGPSNIVNNAIEIDGTSGYAMYVSSASYVNTVNYNNYYAPNSS